MKSKYLKLLSGLMALCLLTACTGAAGGGETAPATGSPTAAETPGAATDPATDPTTDAPTAPAETEGDPIPAGSVLLAKDGRSDYVIVLAEACAPAEQTAANELQTYIAAMTGVTLPIRKDSEGEAIATELVVGNTNRAEAASFAQDDAFRIRCEGQSLYLCGGSPRGTLYAAYHLLETLGCRFFAQDVEVVPTVKTLYLPETTDIQEAPAFSYRDVYWTCAYDADLSAKLKINGTVNKGLGRYLTEEQGGGIYFAGPSFVHTMQYIIPASLFGEHPEYFSEIAGKRTNAHLHSQICPTNPEVLAITIETVRGWLRENPDATLVSVSYNDDYANSYCTCETCRPILEEEGSPAGPMLRFVNAVAEAIEEEFPHVLVETLAYHDTLQAPKVTKARDNVVIRFCASTACCVHAVTECEQNAEVRGIIQDWKGVCPRIYVWEYTSNYTQYLLLKANLSSLQGTLTYYHENDVVGMFAQGIYDEQGPYNGEFGELRSYLLAKLLWDPYADVTALTREFTDAYYGEAAPFIREYLDSIQAFAETTHIKVNTDPAIFAPHLTDENVAHYNGLWEQARAAVAADEACLARVERSEIQYRNLKLQAKRGLDVGLAKYKKMLKDDCIRLGITRFHEGKPIEEW